MADMRIVLYSGPGIRCRVNAIWICCNVPTEVLLLILDRLPLEDQASLAIVNRAFRARVVPVLTGWIWREAPFPFQGMIISGHMGWPFIERAEQWARETGFVACPWCNTIHPPLAAICRSYTGYICQHERREDYEDNHGHFVSLFERPTAWHPLIIYGFIRYTQLQRDTSLLRRAAQLDGNLAVYTTTRGRSEVPFAEEEWQMVWRQGIGLFVRQRVSELVFSDDQGALELPCCPCEQYKKIYDYDALCEEDFSSAIFTEIETGQAPPNDLVESNMLPETHRRSPTLVVGPVEGCDHCGIDWQAAYSASPWEDQAGTVTWTTWFHLGTPNSILEVIDALKDRADRAMPNVPASLGIGNVARLSGLTEGYVDNNPM